MKPGSIFSCRMVAAIAVLNVGCIALPMHVYVADGAEGSQVYEPCSLNPLVPVGVKVTQANLDAIISAVQDRDRALIGVRFDVPKGTTLVLRESAIRIDMRNGPAARVAPFPNVNPAAPSRIPESPAIQKLLLPADTPLRGGRVGTGGTSADKHYWIAAPVEGRLASDVWITLPEFETDSGPSRFPEVHFSRRFVVGQALFNC
jgi:hypothetical protein